MKEWCPHCKTSVRSADRHESKCPVLLRRHELESKPYFCRDVNSYAAGISKQQMDAHVSAIDAQDVLQIMGGVSHDSRLLSLEQLATCMSFRTLVTDNVKLSEYRRHSRSEKLPNKSRHEFQYASIVTAMECFGLLGEGESTGSGSSFVYVEFGAGRGYLSHFIAEMCPGADLVLIDHTAYRFKAERSLKGRLNCSVNRLTIDIKDILLYQVPELQNRNVIGFGKHLCGSATDMALRACFEPCIRSSLKVCGFAVATCCHHRCTWETYVNQIFLSDLGFGRTEFPYLTRISSWATLDKNTRASEEVRERGNKQEKIALGRLAKRILDSGRLQWCVSKGFKAKMVTYIGEHISPENVLLLVKGQMSPNV